jgi:hypothetical protein
MPNHNPNFKENAWKPGVSGNPGGRPAGSRNIRTQEVLDLIRAQGHKDPLVTLSELQNSSDDEDIRATAANMLAPYLHSKLAAKPQPPDPVYVEQAIHLPRPTTIKQAYENIALLTEYKSTAKLDFVTADSLINDQKVILYALIDEAKLLAAQGGHQSRSSASKVACPCSPAPTSSCLSSMATKLSWKPCQLLQHPVLQRPTIPRPNPQMRSPDKPNLQKDCASYRHTFTLSSSINSRTRCNPLCKFIFTAFKSLTSFQ